jgi:hypothetical protein
MNLATFARLAMLAAFVLPFMLVKNVEAQTSRKAEMQHFENITPIDPGGSSSNSPESNGGTGSGGGTAGGGGNDPGVEPNNGIPGNLPMHPPPGASLPIPTFGLGPKQIHSGPPKPEMQHFELRLVPSPVPPPTRTHYLRSYGQVAWPIAKSAAIRTAWSNKWTIAAWAAAKFGYSGAFATKAAAEAAALTATTALGATVAFVTSTGSIVLIPRRIGCEWGPSCEPGPGPPPVGAKLGPAKPIEPPRH